MATPVDVYQYWIQLEEVIQYVERQNNSRVKNDDSFPLFLNKTLSHVIKGCSLFINGSDDGFLLNHGSDDGF